MQGRTSEACGLEALNLRVGQSESTNYSNLKQLHHHHQMRAPLCMRSAGGGTGRSIYTMEPFMRQETLLKD